MLTDPVVRKTILTEVERVFEIANKIAIAKAVAYRTGHPYPDTYEIKPYMTEQGVVLSDIHSAQYDDGWEIDPILITWDEIKNHTTVLADLKKIEAKRKRDEAMDIKRRRKEAYEAMKREFGDA
jgi:hypothetical protein